MMMITRFKPRLVFPGLCSWLTEIALGASGHRMVSSGSSGRLRPAASPGTEARLEDASARDGPKRCCAAQRLKSWRRFISKVLLSVRTPLMFIRPSDRHNWENPFTAEPASNQDEFPSPENRKHFYCFPALKGNDDVSCRVLGKYLRY